MTPTEKPFQWPVTEWQQTRNTLTWSEGQSCRGGYLLTTLKHGTILYETPGLATFPASVCGLARVFDRVQIVGKAGFFCGGGDRLELRDRKTTLWTTVKMSLFSQLDAWTQDSPVWNEKRRRAGLASNSVCLVYSLSLKHRFFFSVKMNGKPDLSGTFFYISPFKIPHCTANRRHKRI